MDTASETNKQAKTDKSASVPTKDTPRLPTAMEAAKNCILQHIATLKPTLQTIFEEVATDHNKILVKAENKRFHISKMEDEEDFIPRSARIKFDFNVSKKADELPEFKQLKGTNEETLIDFQKTLKADIIAATRLELKILHRQALEDLCLAISSITEAFLIMDDNNIAEKHTISMAIAEQNRDEILANMGGATLDDFISMYNMVHGLENAPETIEISDEMERYLAQKKQGFRLRRAGELATQAEENQAMPSEEEITADKSIRKIYRTINQLLIVSWDDYRAAKEDIDKSFRLKKLQTERKLCRATESAIERIDNEMAVDRAHLNQLIAAETNKATTNLNKQIEKLRKDLALVKLGNGKDTPAGKPAKNHTRGQKQGGASKKKQMGKKGKPQKQKRDAPKADDAAKGTKKGSAKKKQTPKHTKKNNQNSQKKKTTGAGGSRRKSS
jgi:hypothetical protein